MHEECRGPRAMDGAHRAFRGPPTAVTEVDHATTREERLAASRDRRTLARNSSGDHRPSERRRSARADRGDEEGESELAFARAGISAKMARRRRSRRARRRRRALPGPRGASASTGGSVAGVEHDRVDDRDDAAFGLRERQVAEAADDALRRRSDPGCREPPSADVDTAPPRSMTNFTDTRPCRFGLLRRPFS